MKRMSVLLILASLVLSSTAFSRDYIDPKYRTRWSIYKQGLVSGDLRYSTYEMGLVPSHLKYSPYAQGLVSDGVYYSPYAAGYNKSGLVRSTVRYTPYAFGYNKSGLVNDVFSVSNYGYSTDYSGSKSRYDDYRSVLEMIENTRQSAIQQSIEAEKLRTAARESVRVNVDNQKVKKTIRQTGPQDILKAFLRDNDIHFTVSRVLRVQGKFISTDLMLTEYNILISFWNPAEILSLQKDESGRVELYDRYLANWTESNSQYIANGGQICQIITSDSEELLAELDKIELN